MVGGVEGQELKAGISTTTEGGVREGRIGSGRQPGWTEPLHGVYKTSCEHMYNELSGDT
jgi:hypothetical protein